MFGSTRGVKELLERGRLLRDVFCGLDGPGILFVTEWDLQETFGWEDVDGKTTVPERDAESHGFAALEVDLIAFRRNFKNTVEGCAGNTLGIEQTHTILLDREFFQATALELDDHG